MASVLGILAATAAGWCVLAACGSAKALRSRPPSSQEMQGLLRFADPMHTCIPSNLASGKPILVRPH